MMQWPNFMTLFMPSLRNLVCEPPLRSIMILLKMVLQLRLLLVRHLQTLPKEILHLPHPHKQLMRTQQLKTNRRPLPHQMPDRHNVRTSEVVS